MAMLYDVDTPPHPLLSERAVALLRSDPTSFEQQGVLAEALLGLVSPAVADTPSVEKIELAVVLQINYQLALGLDPFIKTGQSGGPHGVTDQWRSTQDGEGPPPVHPWAASLVAQVKASQGSRYAGLLSKRGDRSASTWYGYNRPPYWYSGAWQIRGYR